MYANKVVNNAPKLRKCTVNHQFLLTHAIHMHAWDEIKVSRIAMNRTWPPIECIVRLTFNLHQLLLLTMEKVAGPSEYVKDNGKV